MVPRGLSVLPVARGSWGLRSGSGWGPMGTSKSRARTPSELAHDLDGFPPGVHCRDANMYVLSSNEPESHLN